MDDNGPALESANLDLVAAWIRQAERILIVTGAGISADSGLPTYRGVGGLYDSGLTEDGISIEQALSATVFAQHPALTWKYLWQIGQGCADAKPNAAHEILTRLQQRKPEAWVLTQNIDGLHRAAGSPRLIEIHGDAFALRCLGCDWSADNADTIDNYRKAIPLPPCCPACGGLIRPQVVLFEEMLPRDALEHLLAVLEAGPELVLMIGTSGAFPYIMQPVLDARRRGVPSVEINPGQSQLSSLVDVHLRLGAADAMQCLWKRVQT